MSKVYFTADLHLGHKNIGKFRKPTPQEMQGMVTVGLLEESETKGYGDPFQKSERHDDYMLDMCLSGAGKRNTLYILGDMLFSSNSYWRVSEICRAYQDVHLILGNHDTEGERGELIKELWADDKLSSVQSLVKYKRRAWLSHAPIHTDELRGLVNIHGHTHYHTINDKRYICVCPEQNNYQLFDLDTIKKRVGGW